MLEEGAAACLTRSGWISSGLWAQVSPTSSLLLLLLLLLPTGRSSSCCRRRHRSSSSSRCEEGPTCALRKRISPCAGGGGNQTMPRLRGRRNAPTCSAGGLRRRVRSFPDLAVTTAAALVVRIVTDPESCRWAEEQVRCGLQRPHCPPHFSSSPSSLTFRLTHSVPPSTQSYPRPPSLAPLTLSLCAFRSSFLPRLFRSPAAALPLVCCCGSVPIRSRLAWAWHGWIPALCGSADFLSAGPQISSLRVRRFPLANSQLAGLGVGGRAGSARGGAARCRLRGGPAQRTARRGAQSWRRGGPAHGGSGLRIARRDADDIRVGPAPDCHLFPGNGNG